MRRSGRLRAVLFDWDGTLVDSAEASFRSYVRLFESYGITFDRPRFAATYSPDWYRTYEAVGLSRDCWREADARWVELYCSEKVRLLPGAQSALARLREAGLATGLVTSGSRTRIERELASLDLGASFDRIVCCEDVRARKPDPEPLRLALEGLDVASSRAAYVGDSPEDVVMARAAGVFVVGLEGGFPNADALRASGPDLMAPTIGEAIAHLLQRAGSVDF
ncbi:MAG TPA: HAD family hydrolase [Thermoanaerobaculia bacterium]|nr:HAD family hydrolase [Thermoanaerobaculia bacterium]